MSKCLGITFDTSFISSSSSDHIDFTFTYPESTAGLHCCHPGPSQSYLSPRLLQELVYVFPPFPSYSQFSSAVIQSK